MRTIYGHTPRANSGFVDAQVIVWAGDSEDKMKDQVIRDCFNRATMRLGDDLRIFVAVSGDNCPYRELVTYPDHPLSCIVSSVSELETYLEMLCE